MDKKRKSALAQSALPLEGPGESMKINNDRSFTFFGNNSTSPFFESQQHPESGCLHLVLPGDPRVLSHSKNIAPLLPCASLGQSGLAAGPVMKVGMVLSGETGAAETTLLGTNGSHTPPVSGVPEVIGLSGRTISTRL